MKITQQVDIHPNNCDCGLCEPVLPADWTTFSKIIAEMVAWIFGLALFVGLLFIYLVR